MGFCKIENAREAGLSWGPRSGNVSYQDAHTETGQRFIVCRFIRWAAQISSFLFYVIYRIFSVNFPLFQTDSHQFLIKNERYTNWNGPFVLSPFSFSFLFERKQRVCAIDLTRNNWNDIDENENRWKSNTFVAGELWRNEPNGERVGCVALICAYALTGRPARFPLIFGSLKPNVKPADNRWGKRSDNDVSISPPHKLCWTVLFPERHFFIFFFCSFFWENSFLIQQCCRFASCFILNNRDDAFAFMHSKADGTQFVSFTFVQLRGIQLKFSTLMETLESTRMCQRTDRIGFVGRN